MPGKKRIKWDEEKIDYLRKIADSNDIEAVIEKLNKKFGIQTRATVVRNIAQRKGIKIKRKYAINKPKDISAVTMLIRRFKLIPGQKYTVIDKKPGFSGPAIECNLTFLYMDEYKLFFRHELGWVVAYQRHNKLYQIKKEK